MAIKKVIISFIAGFSLPVFSQEIESPTAKRSFEKIRPLLYQLRTSSDEESAKKSYGTAFVVRTDGVLATNYHVVADVLWSKNQENLFLMDGKDSLPAEIINVDVVNDLALVKVGKEFLKTVKIATEAPEQGDKIFSLGLPLDLNWTVTEGNFNGNVNHGIFQQNHITMSINSGMSGGPTVNQRHELIGVNVSRSVSGQQVSFAVPKEFLVDLINDQKKRTIANIKDLREVAHQQILAAQNKMTGRIMEAFSTVRSLNDWLVPKFDESAKCWTQDNSKNIDGIKSTSETCEIGHAILLNDSTYTGYYRMSLHFLTNKSLNSAKFHNAYNSQWSSTARSRSTTFEKDSVLNAGPSECSYHPIKNSAAKVFQAEVCLKSNVPFYDLFDAQIRFARQEKNQRAVIVDLVLAGFNKDNIKKITSKLVDSISEDLDD